MRVGVTTVNFSSNKLLLKKLERAGFEVKKNPFGRRLTFNELLDFLIDCELAIVGLDIINTELLKNLPKLKLISKYGVGLDNIDFQACKKYGVEVFYESGVNKRSVSELALSMMLSLSRNMYTGSVSLKNKHWIKNGGFELSKKKVGIVGFGNIGRDLSLLLEPFQVEIYANDIDDTVFELGPKYVSKSSFDEIILNCDIISFHTPLNHTTRNMIDKNNISKLKKGVILVNTARGGIINEEDIAIGLLNGHIGGLGIDAYEVEPPYNSSLLDLPNTICTPHIGGNSIEAVNKMGDAAIRGLSHFYSNK